MNLTKPVAIGIFLLLISLPYAFAYESSWHQEEPVNLGSIINSGARDAEPTFTADGNTMYFNCVDRTPGAGYDICVSYLKNAEWTEPEIVGFSISTEYNEYEPLVSRDGNTLYIMSDRPGGLGGDDIWVSHKIDGEWIEPVNLGVPINSQYDDHCLYFTGPDGNIAYWTSTRPGGFGGNDIWTSQRINGVWQEPVNLGSNVNSPDAEHHSLPSPNGRSLYITSNRPDGYGGHDIYVTTKDENGNWGKLVNLGNLVNSEKDDRCPAFSADFRIFYFDSERDSGYGSKDLWWVYYKNIKNIH